MSQVDNRNSSAAKRARTDGGRREDDWTCPSCGNVNFSFRTTCNMRNCTQPRPADHSFVSCTICLMFILNKSLASFKFHILYIQHNSFIKCLCYRSLLQNHCRLLKAILLQLRQCTLVYHHMGHLCLMAQPFLLMTWGLRTVIITGLMFLVAALIDPCRFLLHHLTLVDP
ncbi:putative Zinc finger, RanBP2-type [Helianthus annuus]|nr:putative Zinc finger, RanBP2-type [Helianthus annuus]